MVDSQLKWIIDLTIAYPNGKPLDIMTIFCGIAPSCNTVFHYRCYPILEVIINVISFFSIEDFFFFFSIFIYRFLQMMNC